MKLFSIILLLFALEIQTSFTNKQTNMSRRSLPHSCRTPSLSTFCCFFSTSLLHFIFNVALFLFFFCSPSLRLSIPLVIHSVSHSPTLSFLHNHLLTQFWCCYLFRRCRCYQIVAERRCRSDFLVIVLTFVCKQNHSQQFTECLSTNKSKLRKYQKRLLCSVCSYPFFSLLFFFFFFFQMWVCVHVCVLEFSEYVCVYAFLSSFSFRCWKFCKSLNAIAKNVWNEKMRRVDRDRDRETMATSISSAEKLASML